MLYDSTQALKSKKSRTRRVTRLVTAVYWPQQSAFLIQHLSEFLRDRSLHSDRIYEDLINEIANMIAHVAAFTPDEIASLTGDYAHLTISPSLIRRSYPSFEVNSREQIALASRAAAAYERQKDAL